MKVLMFGWEFPPHIFRRFGYSQLRFDKRYVATTRHGYYVLYTETLGR